MNSQNFDNIQQRRPGYGPEGQSGEQQQQQQQQFQFNLFNQNVASTMGAYVLSTGTEKAKQALNIYSHIDYLRPYFDVEPKDVLNRLLYSLVPIDNKTMAKLPTELYGPLMILFTLCAILIYQMKISNQTIQDGTLIGTAFFVCFTYWIGLSFLMSSVSFVCNTTITLFNYLSLIGYAMFSHCVVLLVGTFLHTSFDHFIFYFLWVVMSGAASLKLAYIIYANTQLVNYKIPLSIGIVVVHMSFLLYLHFAYHELAEEVSHALFDKLDNVPAQLDVPKAADSAASMLPTIAQIKH